MGLGALGLQSAIPCHLHKLRVKPQLDVLCITKHTRWGLNADEARVHRAVTQQAML